MVEKPNNDVGRLNADLNALQASKGGLDDVAQQRCMAMGKELETAKCAARQAELIIADLCNQKGCRYQHDSASRK